MPSLCGTDTKKMERSTAVKSFRLGLDQHQTTYTLRAKLKEWTASTYRNAPNSNQRTLLVDTGRLNVKWRQYCNDQPRMGVGKRKYLFLNLAHQYQYDKSQNLSSGNKICFFFTLKKHSGNILTSLKVCLHLNATIIVEQIFITFLSQTTLRKQLS